MFVAKITLICLAIGYIQAQSYNGPTTTPVPILKQINRQNDDGSYSYGYEGADGSFKIETKYPNGDVAGKYGYVDVDSGKLREISYGASSKRGFEPQGSGIMVPPPTQNDNPTNALTDGQEDDGQYREDPKIYEDPKYNSKNRSPANFQQFHQPARQESPRPAAFRSSPSFPQQSFTQNTLFSQAPQQFSQPQQYSQPQQSNLFSQAPQQYNQPQPQQTYTQQYQPEPQYRPQSQVYHQQPQFSYQASTPQQYNQYNPHQNFNPFAGHPAQNFNPNTGSYSIDFTGK